MMSEEFLVFRWLELQDKKKERESQLKLKEIELKATSCCMCISDARMCMVIVECTYHSEACGSSSV